MPHSEKRTETRNLKIAYLYSTGQSTQEQIANMYGISKSRVHQIVKRERILNEKRARIEAKWASLGIAYNAKTHMIEG